jgi:hypothetical protein
MECIGCENHHHSLNPSSVDGPMSGSKLITKPRTTVSFDNNYAGFRCTREDINLPALICALNSNLGKSYLGALRKQKMHAGM